MQAFIENPAFIERARIAVVAAIQDSEKVHGKWIKVAEAVKTAWPTEAVCNKASLKEWIVSGLSKAEREILALAVEDVTDKAARVAAQNKVSQYFKRTIERAYPAPVVAPTPVELTPEQVSAKSAQENAKTATVEWVQAAQAAGQVKAEAAIKSAEAKLTETKAKAAEAAAKLDATKAAEAEALKAQAAQIKAEAEAVKAEAAKADEAAKVKAEAAKALQKAADDQAAAIRLANRVKAVIDDAEALLIKAGSLEGAEGLVDFMTVMRNAVAAFKTANA